MQKNKMTKLLAIIVLGLLFSGNANAINIFPKTVSCSYPQGNHTLNINENEATETGNDLIIIYQSVLYKNNIYTLKSSPGSGAGKKEKRTWTINLATNSGSLFIERSERNYGPFNDYKCIEK